MFGPRYCSGCNGNFGEHLHYRCSCGYEYTKPCKDRASFRPKPYDVTWSANGPKFQTTLEDPLTTFDSSRLYKVRN